MFISVADRTAYKHISSICMVLAFISGCTSSWKAPVHSYSDSGSALQQKTSPKGQITGKYYRVSQGDTLYSIAWRAGTDYQNLATWNKLKSPYTIYAGQVLLTRPPQKVSKPVKTTASKPVPISKKTTSKKTVASSINNEAFKKNLNWHWPATGKLIKGFRKGDDTRKGIVLSSKVGEPITAAEDGKVVYSGSGLIGYGQLIIIKHNNNYLSAYGHNRIILVKEGDWVTKGKKIAEMGMNETGVPALHFEIRKNGDPLNPIAVLPRRN